MSGAQTSAHYNGSVKFEAKATHIFFRSPATWCFFVLDRRRRWKHYFYIFVFFYYVHFFTTYLWPQIILTVITYLFVKCKNVFLITLCFFLKMALVEDSGAGSAADDPEALLNEWLGELTVLTAVCINPYLHR